MNNLVVSESSIHYIVGFLERYADKYLTKHHQDAIKEFRVVSNKLLETLEEPTRISIHRHKIER
jgi:hypothetical protein